VIQRRKSKGGSSDGEFNSAWLLSKRQFRPLTGVEAGTFHGLVERLRPHWQERIVSAKNRSGRPWGVGGLEDHLLVLLILYQYAITQDFMACLYQTDKSTVSRSLQRIEVLTARVLGVKRTNGDIILKLEHGAATVQVRIKVAKSFNESSGLTLHLPLDLRLPVRLIRSMDLWKIAAGERFKKTENLTIQIMTSFSSFLMASSTAKATAR